MIVILAGRTHVGVRDRSRSSVEDCNKDEGVSLGVS